MLVDNCHINDLKELQNSKYKAINNLVSDITSSPNLFPYKLDIQNKRIFFAKMNEKLYKKSFFILSPGEGPGFLKSEYTFSMNFDLIKNIFKNHAYKNNSSIIYNHGFCCSTLLCRLLEESHKVLSLKEPPLINTLKHHLQSNDDSQLIDIIFSLHNRSYKDDQRVLWKPSDYAFDLIDRSESLKIPSIYLFSPLREYIASCSKEKRTEWIKNRADYNKIIRYFDLSESEVDISNTAIQATLYWCYFAKKVNDLSFKNNILALNSNNLLNNPHIVDKVGAHLRLKKKFNVFKRTNIKKLLTTYSKTDDYKFDKDSRTKQLNKIINDNIKDIEKAEKLAEIILNCQIKDFKFKKEII